MIKYDSDSIYNRELQRLRQNPDWQVISNNSLVSSLLKTEAEALAEVGRYSEYLFKESKWDTAQNPNSILAMAGILNYQPTRAISASGIVYWSLDPKIHSVGTTISLQAFQGLKEGGASSQLKNKWYTPASPITITPTAQVIDSKGHRYLMKTSGKLEAGEPWTSLGVIQGVPASQYLTIDEIRSVATKSRLNPYLYIPITLTNCENAATPSTRNFLKVTVFSKGTDSQSLKGQEYVIVNSLLLTTADDYAVELYNDLYNPTLFYLKFPNSTSVGQVLDISGSSSIVSIKVDYIQTLGAAGNIEEAFRTFTMETTSNGQQVKLYGINIAPFLDGQDAEGIADIKVNAPRNYVKNYTVGTRESYENLIKHASLKIKVSDLDNAKTITLEPKQVRVYGGSDPDAEGREIRKTMISFIADGLEDLDVDTSDVIYDNIREALNLYLDKFKSPQDIIKFEAPNFIDFTVGLTLTLDKSITSDTEQLKLDIRDYVDSLWGSLSTELNFDRSFSCSKLQHLIMQQFPNRGIDAINCEVEAITKLNWSLASREVPNKDTTEVIYHTIRAPYYFDPIFLGNSTQKGFMDNRSGTAGSYVLRFDIFYKKPLSLAGINVNSYNGSIFIDDITARSTTGFFLNHSSSEKYWENWKTNDHYTELSGLFELTESHQYPLQQQVYTDSAYQALITKDSSIAERGSAKTDTGALDDYLVYFSGNYTEGLDKIGKGWIEFPFDDIYHVLEVFKYYDATLAEDLNSCPLSVLNCNTSSTEEDAAKIFENFKKILQQYVDIYVSLRPIDKDLIINSKTQSENSVLMIDSTDLNSVSVNNIENLTSVKRPRMISVTEK